MRVVDSIRLDINVHPTQRGLATPKKKTLRAMGFEPMRLATLLPESNPLTTRAHTH
jgi:hypothetical protein